MDSALLKRLGRRINALRAARALSLSALAERARMAKSNLSQLEQGLGNPTVDTLWRLAAALEQPFGALLDPLDGPPSASLQEPQSGVVITLLHRGSRAQDPYDVYLMRLAPHTRREACAHPAGVVEHALVLDGALELGVSDAPERLQRGETIRFDASRPHCYRSFDTDCEILLTILYHQADAQR